jgi:predicted aspartyl protease
MINIRNHVASAILLVCASLCLAVPTHADECRLVRVASLDMTDTNGGRFFVPVTIEGTSELMLVDTGAPATTVEQKTATDLQLITHRLFADAFYNSVGEEFKELAIIHSLGIDQLHASNVHALVQPSPLSHDTRMAGTLGVDLLGNYDVDLDFAAHKMNLMSPDHCPGKVVYWSADTVAVVPIRVVQDGHIIVPVTLDGRELDAILDTGASQTILSQEAAQNIFGLQPGTSDTPEIGHLHAADAPTVYSHMFKTLTLEGLTIGNPTVIIFPDLMKDKMEQSPSLGSRLSGVGEANGVTDLTLGMKELRRLHLYISYKEKKLYITPAGPTAAAAAPAAAASQ